MQNAPRFSSLREMDNSEWMHEICQQFSKDTFPNECIRCCRAEAAGMSSMRQREITRFASYYDIHPSPLKLNIEFDTICNAACQICHYTQSSHYAKLLGIPVVTHNVDMLREIDPARVIDIEITGGEPVASNNVRRFLSGPIDKYPLQRLRINTNGSAPIKELTRLLDCGLLVTVTLSMDGTGKIFEYCRFPVKWDRFCATLSYYKSLMQQYTNFTVELYQAISVLSLASLNDSKKFAEQQNVFLGMSLIAQPSILQVQKNNFMSRYALSNAAIIGDNKVEQQVATESVDSSAELLEFIRHSDAVRGIRVEDYYPEFDQICIVAR